MAFDYQRDFQASWIDEDDGRMYQVMVPRERFNEVFNRFLTSIGDGERATYFKQLADMGVPKVKVDDMLDSPYFLHLMTKHLGDRAWFAELVQSADLREYRNNMVLVYEEALKTARLGFPQYKKALEHYQPWIMKAWGDYVRFRDMREGITNRGNLKTDWVHLL